MAKLAGKRFGCLFLALIMLLLLGGCAAFREARSINEKLEAEAGALLSQMMTAYYLVCEGQGVTLLRDTIPEYVTPNDNIVFYQLDDPLAFRSIYLSYPKKELPAMHRELIDYLIDKGDAEGLS